LNTAASIEKTISDPTFQDFTIHRPRRMSEAKSVHAIAKIAHLMETI